jgi:hypothetical protein
MEVFVGGLPAKATEYDLHTLFYSSGGIKNIVFIEVG